MAPAAPEPSHATGHRAAGLRARWRQDRRPPLAAGCALAFGCLVILAAQPDDSGLGRLDQAMSAHISTRRSATAILVARRTSALAEPSVVAIPLAAAVAAAIRRGGWLAGAVPCLTVLTGVAVRLRLSQAVARPRPPAAFWLAEPEGFSLPSRHTCLAALTAGACARAHGASAAGSQAAAAAAAALVGASRIVLGVHWPTHVAAGWLFAAGWLGLAELGLAELGLAELGLADLGFAELGLAERGRESRI